jgi:hypothetical protein
MGTTPRAVLGLALLAVSCGRPFFRSPPEPVPFLSQAPAQPGLSSEESVIHFLVQYELQSRHYVDSFVVADKTEADIAHGYVMLPREWPDSLHLNFTAAWMAYRARNDSAHLVPASAVVGLNARVGGAPAADQPCGQFTHKPCRIQLADLAISAVGFNSDSTTAVVYTRVWCGPVCGSADMWVLKRAPGHEWIVLRSQLLWISVLLDEDSSRAA